MKRITGITDQPNQQFNVSLDDGSRLRVTFNYRVQQQGWFADFLWTKTSGATFEISGMRVVSSPNILRAWRDLLPFGLMVYTDSLGEPTTVKAFSYGTSKLFLLSATEVADAEANLFPGRP